MKKRAIHRSGKSMLGLLAIASMPLAIAVEKQANDPGLNEAAILPDVTVTEQAESPETQWRAKAPIVEKYKLPATTESVTVEEIEERVNLLTVEDAIKYEPSIEVRKRYIGDTNEPLGTRSATISQSARTMIYADGILLSTFLNNNNSNTGSPRWNTVAPGELLRADMMYGPFSAQYAGNSLGGVLNLTTKMPQKFEAGADIQGSWGSYNIYGSKGDTDSQNYSANIGDKVNDLAFRFDFNHLDSLGQPISFLTQTVASGATPTAFRPGTNVNGAVLSANSTGAPMYVFGANNGQYSTHQDNFKWKLAYDITPTLQASYTLGMWQNSQEVRYASYLRDALGNSISSGFVNINNKQYNLGTTVFSPLLADQTTWSHGMALKSNTGGKFDWELIGSIVDLGTDTSRVAVQDPATVAASASGGLGRNTVLTGSNWHTADAKGIWRPGDFHGKHEVSFGFHNDYYQLVNPVYNTLNWQSGGNAGLFSNSEGKTMTQGYWLQDAWDFDREWNLTAGGRLENWDAYDGLNSTTVGGALKTINQSNRNSVNFSPKGKLTWNPNQSLRFGAAIAQAYRYPTAGELFQSSTVGTTVYNANPNLRPEEALSSEFSSEYFLPNGKLRLSFFQEKINNAIYAMSTLLSNGAVANTNQNVGQTDLFGLEFSGEAKDVWIDTLNLYGSGTWTDGRITSNAATDAAALIAAQSASNLATNPGTGWPSTGAMLPRIPTYRATFTVSYSPIDKMTTSISGRYSSATFSQLNNSDINHMTYVGNSAYFVVDAKVNYKFSKQWSINAGIDNLNNEHYWIFHPFTQRTYTAQLKFNY